MAEVAPAAAGDKIAGPFSGDLAGRAVEYRYSTGNHYRLVFGAEQLAFVHLNAPEPHEPVPLAYVGRRLRPAQYLVHWAGQGRGHPCSAGLRPQCADRPRVGAYARRMGVLGLCADREYHFSRE